MLIDLHVHTTYSRCSVLDVSDLLDNARKLGLDGVCITDHDTSEVLSQIREGFQSDGLLVLVGMEYTTAQGDFLVFGEVTSLPSGLDGQQLLGRVEDMGGATIAAHPFRSWRPADVSILCDHGPVTIEVANGRNTDFENALASGLAHKHGLSTVAGSDAHSLAELGRYPTRFQDEIASTADLVRALRASRCQPHVTGNGLAAAS